MGRGGAMDLAEQQPLPLMDELATAVGHSAAQKCRLSAHWTEGKYPEDTKTLPAPLRSVWSGSMEGDFSATAPLTGHWLGDLCGWVGCWKA